MEAEQTLTCSEIQDDFIANALEQKLHSRGVSDITTKRLKNRERQRRYRARKRLEADSKKASVTNQSTTSPPQVEVELNGHHNGYIIHTPCKRNWKKDARKVRACKNLEETHTGPFISALPLDIECQPTCLAPGIMTEPPQEKQVNFENAPSLPSCETHKTKLGRRDWKAEARNKTN